MVKYHYTGGRTLNSYTRIVYEYRHCIDFMTSSRRHEKKKLISYSIYTRINVRCTVIHLILALLIMKCFVDVLSVHKYISGRIVQVP